MLRWNNDYNHGALPEILSALQETNCEAYCGYGLDEWCVRASAEIKKYLGGADADIHFLIGGTQVNYTLIASALLPFQSVISADSGHINVHETGAVENTGHKIQTVEAENGKISASAVEELALLYESSGIKEHITQPKLVYISQPTEFGTLYSKAELEELSAVCRKHDLLLYADGARLAYALGSPENDASLADLAETCDAFYIGGTKCGTLFGEALVLINDSLKPNFRSYIKQNGAMLAKGWLLGLQFYTMFADGLYFKIGEKADEYAVCIREAFHSRGIKPFIPSNTNQQFVIVNEDQLRQLGENHIYEYDHELDGGQHCIRFCTSWCTSEEDVRKLTEDIHSLDV